MSSRKLSIEANDSRPEKYTKKQKLMHEYADKMAGANACYAELKTTCANIANGNEYFSVASESHIWLQAQGTAVIETAAQDEEVDADVLKDAITSIDRTATESLVHHWEHVLKHGKGPTRVKALTSRYAVSTRLGQIKTQPAEAKRLVLTGPMGQEPLRVKAMAENDQPDGLSHAIAC
jgi:hypothetical protein